MVKHKRLWPNINPLAIVVTLMKSCDILCFLDTEKASLTNKRSERYEILCIVTFVRGFKEYQNEAVMSEASHLRMFVSLPNDLLMTTKSISLHDGEMVSRATQRMKIMTGEDNNYDGRIDLIVRSKQEEQQYKLCSNEFKKLDVSLKIQIHQQSKNIRINACIINELNLLLANADTSINYFNFCGRQAYIAQMFNFSSCLVSFKVGSFTIPKNLAKLDHFRSSLIDLYNWKKCTMDNSNKVAHALARESEKYGISDISFDVTSPSMSPPRNAVPMVQVKFSPSKGFKRIRDVFKETH